MRSIDKKIIISWIIIVVYAILLGVLAKVYVDHGGFNAENADARHIAQISAVGMGVLVFLILRRLYKLFPKEKYKKVYDRVKQKVKQFAAKIYGKLAKLVGRLGLGGGKKFAKGEDEYSFIFGDEEKKRIRMSIGTVNKWNALADNSERIRFLFIKYMLGRIRRGYRRRWGKTHMEWGKELGVKDDTYVFFEDYGAARYGAGSVDIPDEAVERAKKIVGNRK